MKKSAFLIFILFVGTAIRSQTPQLIFNSGFENNVTVSPVTATTSDLLGTDTSLSTNNNWKTHLDGHPNIGYSVIQFDDAAATSRGATIINDPVNQTNKAIQFWSKTPNSTNNFGRIQGCIYGNNGLKNILTSVKMYLPSDINILKQMPNTFDWFTIMEFWNSPNWTNDPYPFRISLNIRKLKANSSTLSMRAYAQKFNPTTNSWVYIWDNTNITIDLPVEKWFTLETHIIEGNAQNGKFIATITANGEPTVQLFDINNYTHHPDELNNNGIDYINPFKLYTAANLVNYVSANNGILNVLYDDFKIWKDVPLSSLHTKNNKLENSFLYWDYNTQTIKYKSNDLKSGFKCKLFDLSGKLVFEMETNNPENFIIHKTKLSSAIYYYQIYNKEKNFHGKIFIP